MEFSAAKAMNLGPPIPLSWEVDDSPLLWLDELVVAPLVLSTFGLRFTAINCEPGPKDRL